MGAGTQWRTAGSIAVQLALDIRWLSPRVGTGCSWRLARGPTERSGGRPEGEQAGAGAREIVRGSGPAPSPPHQKKKTRRNEQQVAAGGQGSGCSLSKDGAWGGCDRRVTGAAPGAPLARKVIKKRCGPDMRAWVSCFGLGA